MGYSPQPLGYYPFAYDAIYAMAFAMNDTENRLINTNKSLADFQYNDTGMAKMLKESMDNVRFHGLTVSNFILFIHDIIFPQPLYII